MLNVLRFLSYSNLSALITIPFSALIDPRLFPINLFPLSKICISVTSKLNCSAPIDLNANIEKNKIIYMKLFFIYFV